MIRTRSVGDLSLSSPRGMGFSLSAQHQVRRSAGPREELKWREQRILVTDYRHRHLAVFMAAMGGSVIAVSLSKGHPGSKGNQKSIRLITGEGVVGDDHCGEKVQHIYSKRVNPNQPNLRQVHLIHSELHDELKTAGFNVGPGQMGENVTTRGIDLLSFPLGTRLHIGSGAILEVTGIRHACGQLNTVQKGLLKAVQYSDGQGNLIRKCGIMTIVVRGDEVRPGDEIQVELPAYPHVPLPALS